MIVDTIDVAAAGTRVQSGKKGSIKSLLARARSANTGTIYIGDSVVSSSAGLALEPGEAITIHFNGYGKMQDFYADADTSGDDVDLIGDNS